MLIAGAVILWWLSAFAPLLLMGDREALTWGGLLILIVVSFIGGPILGLTMLLAILSSLDFWHRPIWPRKN